MYKFIKTSSIKQREFRSLQYEKGHNFNDFLFRYHHKIYDKYNINCLRLLTRKMNKKKNSYFQRSNILNIDNLQLLSILFS